MAELSEYQALSLGRALANRVIEFYKDPKNMKKFEEWFLKTHGISYEEYCNQN